LGRIDTYWRAAKYLPVRQLYRNDDPLLRRPLELADSKSVVVGDSGTTPRQSFTYMHLNRLSRQIRSS
jgi:xylulose-5-phosphate/fructose-6-phosphate phosphoketolase